MARTKTSQLLQPPSSTAGKDPWDVEHDLYLRDHPNAIAHSDTIYTGVVHKGFDADIVAEELIRRYPAFEENEQHHEFLTRNITDRRLLAGERDDYISPEQLWDEDDRIHGRKRFSSDGEQSWLDEDVVDDEPAAIVAAQEYDYRPAVPKWMPKDGIGEDDLESDELLAELLSDPAETLSKLASPLASPRKPGDPAMTEADMAELFGEDSEPPAITVTTPEKKTGTPQADDAARGLDEELPIVLQSDGHSTTITLDYSDAQEVLESLDLSPKADLTAITSTFVDGSLVLAVLGRVQDDDLPGDNTADSAGPAAVIPTNNKKSPAEVQSNPGDGVPADDQQSTNKASLNGKEWTLPTQRPHHSKLTFLSGPRTYIALKAELNWDQDSVVATMLNFTNGGRVLAILVGKQSDPDPDPDQLDKGLSQPTFDPADAFHTFFTSLRKHSSFIPQEHADLASFAQVAHQDMISARTLAAPGSDGVNNDDDNDSDSDSECECDFETEVPAQGDRSAAEHIALLQFCIAQMERKISLALEAQKQQKLPASLHSVESCSRERLRDFLAPLTPQAEDEHFFWDLRADGMEAVGEEEEDDDEAEEEEDELADVVGTTATTTTTTTTTTLGKRRRSLDDEDGESTYANGVDTCIDSIDSALPTPEKKPQRPRPRKIARVRDAPEEGSRGVGGCKKGKGRGQRKRKLVVVLNVSLPT